LHQGIERAVAKLADAAVLRKRFRVERTSAVHNDIPGLYAPSLLNDIAAGVPKASPPPSATTRPDCVANDDWLTATPRKPGGDDPPPPAPAAPTEDAWLPAAPRSCRVQ
jgi:hypothetical protein